MKNKILFGAVLLIALLTAFKFAPNNNGNATVEQIEGIYVYSFSKPTEPNEYLGTVKGGNNGFNEPSGMITKLIREAKKKYPGVQGVIVAPDNNKADCVKFKQ